MRSLIITSGRRRKGGMFPRSRDEIERHLFSALGALTLLDIQGSAKRRALGSVNPASRFPLAAGGRVHAT